MTGLLCALCAALIWAGQVIAQIPVIDLSLLGKDIKPSIEIDLALQEYGVFVGTNIIEKALSDKFIKAAYSFFNMDMSVKESIKVNEGGFMRGYIPFGQESGLLNKYFEPKEGFSYGYSFDEENDKPFLNALEGDNVWPTEKDFKEKSTLKLLFDISTRISINIVRSISASYKHHTNKDLGLLLDGGDRISIMRLFHYFAKSSYDVIGDRDEDSIMGSSPHTDWGLLTVITQQEQVGGLQVFYKGTWIDVPSNIPGSVVVNGGDFLSLVSKGRYKSPVHRVKSPESRNRVSFVYFYYPNFQSPYSSVACAFDTKREYEEDVGQYNTLMSGDTVENCGEREVLFGDYIISKWRGVYRDDEVMDS